MEQDLSPRPYRFQENSQYPSNHVFADIVKDYLAKLSFKKRDKALIDRQRYELILQVLQEPKNTSLSTAQFRFWVKKMFQLVPLHNGRLVVCHDHKPVAMRDQIYHILIWAHRQCHHGGRDKTSTLVRRRFSWIPKELIAAFVRHCPFCITRRNGHADMFSSYATMQYYQQTNSAYSSESAFMNSNSIYQSPMSTPPIDPIPPCCNGITACANNLHPPISAERVLSDDIVCPLPSSSSSSTHSAALTTSSTSTSTTRTANSPTSGSPLYVDHPHQRYYPPLSQPSSEELFIKDTSSLADCLTTTTIPCLHTSQHQQHQVHLDGYELMNVNTMDPTMTSSRSQEQQSMLASPMSPLSPSAFGFGPKQIAPNSHFVNKPSLNLMSFF